MSAVVIRLEGLASGGPPTPEDGLFVKEYDPDALGGLGHVRGVRERKDALVFANAMDAVTFYRQVSTVRPLRDDGRFNRPLTAYTITIEPLEGVGHHDDD